MRTRPRSRHTRGVDELVDYEGRVILRYFHLLLLWISKSRMRREKKIKNDAENISSSIQLIFFHSIALHNT